MKVAAYQMDAGDCYATRAVEHIREQVQRCEALGVAILCCPEGALGGLADYVDAPARIAIDAHAGMLDAILAPLASDTVTSIVGFTEIDRTGRLYNSAAVFHQGAVAGVYRKRHPAIHSSRYVAGTDAPLFTLGGLTFGILVCRDSLDAALAHDMVRRGAAALFVPTNNAMPRRKSGPELVAATRELDVRRAAELEVAVVRADVVGATRTLVSFGTSAIISRGGVALSVARPGRPELVLAEIPLPVGSSAPPAVGGMSA